MATISHRGTDKDGKGIWRIRVFVDGKQKSITYHGSERGAQRTAAAAENRREQGETVAPSKVRVSEYLIEWMDTYQRHEVTPQSLRNDRGFLNLHIIPSIGEKRMASLSPMDCQKIVNRLAQEGKTRTAVMVFNMMKKAFRKAVELGYLVKNPMDAVTKPRDRAKERPALTVEQAATFLEAAQTDSLYAFLSFLLLTGTRPEEAQGLKWEDVNLSDKTVSIRRSMKRVPGGGWEFADLKTTTSRRNLDLGERLADILRKHKKEQAKVRLLMGEDWTDNGLVFANQAGNPVDTSRARKHLSAILSRTGLPEIRLYDLRHSHGSMLLDQDVNIKAISDRLGHANTSMTVNRYLHAQRSQSREGVNRLDAALEDVGKKDDEHDAQ
ncbi:MAG: site-specific integrase [Sulfobacillus thermotolerans]|nr:site-specific integrase [Sulfobacillus thermotolerans]